MNKSIIWKVAAIAIAALSIVIALSSFRGLRKMELEFNEKKASLVKENLDLKDKLDSIQDMINQKTESLGIAEQEKNKLSEELETLKKENENLLVSSREQLDEAKRKNASLKKRIATLENSPVLTRIKDALEGESNDNIRKVLEDSIVKIEMIKEGKAVNLEPIIVTKPQSERSSMSGEEGAQGLREGIKGTILSFEKKNSLIVVSLGRKDNIKEGDRLKVLKDDKEIAEAEIISVRYRISAAAVNDVLYKHTLNDIKEGYKVVVLEG